MPFLSRVFCLLLYASSIAKPVMGQAPFYTDDPAVTQKGKVHFEFFNEYDFLQLQYPNIRQNTSNYKLNFGLPFDLELDVDFPYLAIFRAVGEPDAIGGGDTNLGVKWEFHRESPGSAIPALGVSFYTEFPTGDASRQLGSGIIDYWLNLIAQKSLSDKTRVNGNLGYLFAGNTTTGVLGIQTTRGHVYVGGLSILHDFVPRLTVGGEIYGGFTRSGSLGRNQLQVQIGGEFLIRRGLSFTFGVIGGRYVASPRIGAQAGFAVDFPDALRGPAKRSFTIF